MSTSRTLQPEDQLAHYRVVGPLGAGGMGEVYLAQDQTLERNVALKVLPQELVRSEERVRRFVQEAKSASSLNHPNIITIYEIGQDTVKSASGEASTGSVQFISMELVSGKTLGARIHEEKTDLRTLLGYLAQAAEGIAKAHAAGIVHRDLKPGNIMVSDDGFAKVLDFGLAKLTEQRSGEASASAMTEVGGQTAEGAVLGTVYYMSPEQVQGKSVDHRSDIFSFGCMLYEATTRQRPFLADSNVETMHKILHDKPAPIEEINPAAPAELRRLIRRCLNKAPDQRLQSMKDLALELREIADEYDSLSVSATSATTGSGSMAPIVGRRGRRVPLVPVIAAGAVVIAAALFFALRDHGREAAVQSNPFENMRIHTATSRGNVSDCIMSPDGRYLAYLVVDGGRFGMFVRQVATGSDVEVLPMDDRIVESPVFSPDGNYLFYLARDPETPLYRTLFRMASLGGPSEKRAFDVDSRVSFSPDGTQFAFTRGFPQEGRTAIFVMPIGGGAEKELVSVRTPEVMSTDAVWSPDGKTIATIVLVPPPVSQSTVVTFDVDTGKRSDILQRKQAFYLGIGWMGDGSGLLATGVDLNMGFTNQIYMVSYPGGQVRRITNDFNQYQSPSASKAGDGIAAVRTTSLSNLWSVGVPGGDAVQLTRATSTENTPSAFNAGEKVVYYSMVRDQFLRLFAMPSTGGDAQLITTPPGHVTNIRSGGDVIVLQIYNEGEQHLWRIGTDGSGARRLSDFAGENLLDISPDGKYATFAVSDSVQGVWIVPTAGGEPRLLAPKATRGSGVFSPDGSRVLVGEFEHVASLLRIAYKAYPCEGDGAPLTVSTPQTAINLQWLPDGSGLSYIDRSDPARNVSRLSFGGGEPVRVTRFTDQQVTNYAYSLDGKHVAVVRQVDNYDNVWLTDAAGGNARQLTTFAALSVFGMRWMPDSSRLIGSVGNATRDVVLIRDFR
ncbi:MAG: protein kinase [Candidatus Krumholzibacteria bacterium]|nr:protein kinase [Candidatus Krumholzibacteria bacterium]MDH4337796.1 protein kinase [Candidatus Krumholzibacteria bacterium]MDH5270850.1 protein kinase [Candidatus Krumholzibacteria bacterium]